VDLDINGQASIVASDVDNNSSDVCGIASLSVSPSTFDCNDTGAPVNVTLTVTDNNGNPGTCTADVTVQDVTPPTALCQFATVQLGAGGTATVTAANIDGGSIDACSGTGTALSRIVSPSQFSCSQLGQHTVTLTVNDAPGNSATCTATVTVEDNIAPIAKCKHVTISLDATGSKRLYPSDVNNGSSDNCGIVSKNVNGFPFVLFGCANVGTNNTVSLRVSDGSNPMVSCLASITLTDPLSACCAPPTALCQNATVQLDANGFAQVATSQVDNGSTAPCDLARNRCGPQYFWMPTNRCQHRATDCY
jgi:hypothetical protein